MLAYRTVIVDNTALVYLTHLQEHCDIFSALRLIFTQVLIPTEIKREYEFSLARNPKRSILIDQIRPNVGFYALCTRYDSVTFEFLRTTKGINDGEAEAAAQHRKIGAYCIISDDKKFSESILKIYPNIRIINSLHIIAMLELQKIVASCDGLKQKLYKVRPYKSKDLREAYIDTAKVLGLVINKKVIYKMTKFGHK